MRLTLAVRLTKELQRSVLQRSPFSNEALFDGLRGKRDAYWSAFGARTSHLPALPRCPKKSARSCFPAKSARAGLDKFFRIRHADRLWLAGRVLPLPARLVP